MSLWSIIGLIFACSGFLLAVYIHQIEARRAYIARIPNGDSVPNTCATDQGSKWTAIGHVAIGGGGARNPFGIDFAANGLVSHQTDMISYCGGYIAARIKNARHVWANYIGFELVSLFFIRFKPREKEGIAS